MQNAGGVWIFAEQSAGELQRFSLELTCGGRVLANKLGEELSAVILGHEIEHLAVTLSKYGAEKVYLIDNALIAQYNSDLYVTALVDLVKEYTPSIVLFSATSIGRDIAPRIAGRIGAGIVTECIDLKIDKDGLLNVIRPVYNGRLFATLLCPFAGTYIVTVSPGAMETSEPDGRREAKTFRVTPILEAAAVRTKFLDFVPADPRTIDITEAEIIVAGGKGVGEADKFHLIQELADQLGGSVGGTRPVVDAGWLPLQRQIGLTGKFVSPKLFISCGISGQFQHTVGMKDSSAIIAINTDPNAPIFKLADLAIMGDLHEVIPSLIKQLRALKKEEQ